MFSAILDGLTRVTAFLAAASGFILVIYAGPRELKKWRRQKLDERKAEVASSALVASLDLLQALDAASMPLSLQGDPEREAGQPYPEYMRKWFGQRMEPVQQQLDALAKIRMQAHVYLSNEENSALDDVAKHVNFVMGEFMTWATFIENEELRKEAVDAFSNVFGSAPNKKREELRTRVTETLRPSAQFKNAR